MKTIGPLPFILILSGFFVLRCEATVYLSDGSVASVQALHNAAHDGDTITLPAGIFRWTAGLNITKGVTIQGATTITGAGTANPIINDGTIVLDDTPRSGRSPYILAARMATSTQSFRLTGITFRPGSITASPLTSGPFRLHSDVENKLMRVDHCHFDYLYQARCIWVSGWCEGVADHNVMESRTGIGSTQAFLIQHHSYGNAGALGNGSWADYPRYGTDKFFFIEDNTIEFGAATDTDLGARFVFRHNYTINAIVAGHGTEGGSSRGGRANEVYDNTFNWTQTLHGPSGGQRSGTCLWHDNIVTGTPSSVAGVICNFTNYRENYVRAHPIWGIADGTSVWDANDTEGNGRFVEGHAPHLFASGSATVSTPEGTLTDSTKNWTPNQWVGYSIRNTNPASASYGIGCDITSNTSTTITHPNFGGAGHLIFNSGDTYEIHRVLVMVDQNGRGKGDRVAGDPPINTTTGMASWNYGALEPCYSWNNVYTPKGHALGFNSVSPTTIASRDYHNLGAGFFAHDATPLIVSLTYKAALNGVNYFGTFVYPHPLVTAQPTSTASTTACSLLQQRLDRLQRRHQRLKRLHIPHQKLKRRLQRVQLQLQLQHCL